MCLSFGEDIIVLLREGLNTGYNFEAMNHRKEKSINIDEFLINKIFYH